MTAKLVICASNNDSKSLVSDRFARSNYFCLYSEGNYTFVENNAKNEMSGAGGKAVKQIGSLDAEVVLVPEVGPKAFDALEAFELKAYKYPKGATVEEVVELFLNNKLEAVEAPSKTGKHH